MFPINITLDCVEVAYLARQPADEILAGIVRKVQAATEQALAEHKDTLCIVAGCTNRAECRGNCKRHYDLNAAEVREGRSNWDGLVTAGRCKPSARPTARRLARIG